MRILLVEDDRVLGDGLQAGLSLEGHTVDWLTCGDDAAAAVIEPDFDIVILDLGLPDRSGRKILEEWRRSGIRTPVLILTACDSESNCVPLLDIGADDYVTKPIPLKELSARLRALTRRSVGYVDNMLSCGAVSLDRGLRRAFLSDTPVELSTYEFIILETLMKRPGHPVSRATLEAHLYGWNEGPESNSLEVLIHKLRRRLGRDRIATLRGVGYRIDA